ncbi:MAG: fatty acid desaturase [Methylococcales bacterium]
MRYALAEPLQIRIFTAYLLSLLIPGYSFLFVLTGPHSFLATILWILPMWSTVLIDMGSPPSRKQPDKVLHPMPYDGILYLLAALQFLAILALMDFSTRLNFGSPSEWATSLLNLFAIKVIVGTSSSFSGIVVAHELIHRPGRFNQTLGRLLLALEGYEHFATEHIHGHHKNFGAPADPATARFGESYEEFWKRTVPTQFINAWKLENERLGIKNPIGIDSRFCAHRVAQGVLLELIMLIGIALTFGIKGLIVFAVQAIAAVRKLEAVNYIEHWGLCRTAERAGKPLSWDTDSWFTLNAMVGLSRHSDHHRHVGKPFHQLRYSVESPKLPYGYFATVFLAVSFNRRYQTLIRREMDRLGLAMPFTHKYFRP